MTGRVCQRAMGSGYREGGKAYLNSLHIDDLGVGWLFGLVCVCVCV